MNAGARSRWFWLKLSLFTLPFALLFVVFTGSLLYMGETMPLALVVQMQMGDAPVLYRPRFGPRDLTYKALSVNLRKPEIIVAGSSRVTPIRALFFDRRARAFYNAAGLGWQLEEVERFLRGIAPDATPKLLILGIDHPWFNERYDLYGVNKDFDDFRTLFAVNRSVLQIMLDGGTIDFGTMLARREPGYGGMALGMGAIGSGQGYRNDGSFQYGNFTVTHELSPETERQKHLDWLQDGEDMYVRGDAVYDAALAKLERILAYCHERGIQVIGFSPPYMPALHRRMMADGQHTYIQRLVPRLSDLFARYGDSYFDFSDVTALGLTDDDFFDGWHASERVYLRIHMAMVKALPGQLGPYSDLGYLEKADAGAASTFDVFGNQVVP